MVSRSVPPPHWEETAVRNPRLVGLHHPQFFVSAHRDEAEAFANNLSSALLEFVGTKDSSKRRRNSGILGFAGFNRELRVHSTGTWSWMPPFDMGIPHVAFSRVGVL